MKKFTAAILIATFLATPFISFAVEFDEQITPISASPGIGSTAPRQPINPATGIANTTAAGEVVGCQTTGLGGALAQTLGAALQQAIPGFLRSQLQGPLSKLASKAGPFGGLVSSLANMAINKLSTFLQNKVGQLLGGITGTAGQAIGLVTGGAGAGAPSVPVDLHPANPDVVENIDKTKSHTSRSADADEQAEGQRCVSNPLVAKLKNALLSMIYKSIIDFANGGFDGEQAIIANLEQFVRTGVESIVQDFISNATAGICAKDQAEVKTILLTQYEYEIDYSKQSQCTDESPDSKQDDDNEKSYTRMFHLQNTGFGAAITAESALKQQKSETAFKAWTTAMMGQGIQPTKTCTDGSVPKSGETCKGGTFMDVTTLTGDQKGHVIKKAITGPIDQLFTADEIGELVDAFTAGLTQFIFSGIDGLKGASKKSGNNGSYLDATVQEASGGAVTGTQNLVGSDIVAAADIEQEYLDTVSAAIVRVELIKTTYTSAIACYKVVANTSSANQLLAQQRMTNASSTIATILNPQIAVLTALKQKSQAALSQYDDLLTRVSTAEAQDDYILIYTDFQTLLASGLVHTTPDLMSLQSDIDAADASLDFLSTDAAAQLSECRAL